MRGCQRAPRQGLTTSPTAHQLQQDINLSVFGENFQRGGFRPGKIEQVHGLGEEAGSGQG